MSSEGWITESRPRHVKLTHWGIAAAKKLAKRGRSAPEDAVGRQAAVLKSETKELATLADEFAQNASSDNFFRLEKKLTEISSMIAKVRESI